MTTPSTSALSASDINTENGYASNQQMSFDDAVVRSLAGAPGTGTTISMALLRGKSRVFNLSAATPIQNLNIYNTLIAGGWPGVPAATYTIPAGIYIWSDDTSLPGMETGGPFPNGVTIVNSGYIIGRGGNGAQGFAFAENQSTGYEGNPGGSAINISSTGVVIVNNPGAYIAGGGGSGGSGWKHAYLPPGTNASYGPAVDANGGGGGAGGGIGGTGHRKYATSTNPNAAGGTGGVIGQRGKDGAPAPGSIIYFSGGGGGRILPGVLIVGSTTYGEAIGAPGYYSAPRARSAGVGWGGEAGGGAGGNAGPLWQSPVTGWPSQWYGPVARAGGGNGGDAGYPGARPQGPGTNGFDKGWIDGGSGGGWGAPGGTGGWAEGSYTPARGWGGAPGARGTTPAGTGGKAINLNGQTITQTNNGTIYGAVA